MINVLTKRTIDNNHCQRFDKLRKFNIGSNSAGRSQNILSKDIDWIENLGR